MRSGRNHGKGKSCACGKPISDYATWCLSCSAKRRNDALWGEERWRKCSSCLRPTRNLDRLCDECAGRARWTGDPEECPRCAGLPWRRGENEYGRRVADHCPACGLPYEPEGELRVEMFARRQREEVAA